jgi:ankyrin repeat protein
MNNSQCLREGEQIRESIRMIHRGGRDPSTSSSLYRNKKRDYSSSSNTKRRPSTTQNNNNNTVCKEESMNLYNDNTPGTDTDVTEILVDRPFKDKHHPIIQAIWNVEKFNPKIDEKLIELKSVVNKYDVSVDCDILHDISGQPIAQATPLLVACFEGDPDVIKFLIKFGADVNQTESEHHLTALHVICDAEYHGQTLRVFFLFLPSYFKNFNNFLKLLMPIK